MRILPGMRRYRAGVLSGALTRVFSRPVFSKSALLKSALLLFIGLQCAEAGWIHAKAALAQVLIQRAWQDSLDQPDMAQRPWSWADTWPVMRLQWRSGTGSGQEDQLVLADVSGSSLAFGPGHYPETAQPGAGALVLAGHRDTHFAFLDEVRVGDRLRLQDSSGRWFSYRVSGLDVVDSRTEPLRITPDAQQLILMTCYPFTALNPGGPLRYLVTATLEADEADSASLALFAKLWDTPRLFFRQPFL